MNGEARVTAGIGIGANLGDPEQAVWDAIAWLRTLEPGTRLVRASSPLWTAPWGKTDQPDFVNAVAIVETELPPRALLDVLLAKEASVGRVRTETWGPRVLDLDLLWWGDAVLDEAGITLPHPGIAERAFVLDPLAEIAPEWRHPRTGKTAAEMLVELYEDDETREGAQPALRARR